MPKQSESQLGNIIKDAKNLAGINGFRAYAQLVSDRRDECAENGHQLGCTKKEFYRKTHDDTCICMNCEAFLDPDFIKELMRAGVKFHFLEDETLEK